MRSGRIPSASILVAAIATKDIMIGDVAANNLASIAKHLTLCMNVEHKLPERCPSARLARLPSAMSTEFIFLMISETSSEGNGVARAHGSDQKCRDQIFEVHGENVLEVQHLHFV
jgi:hypothetical protein